MLKLFTSAWRQAPQKVLTGATLNMATCQGISLADPAQVLSPSDLHIIHVQKKNV